MYWNEIGCIKNENSFNVNKKAKNKIHDEKINSVIKKYRFT